MDDKKKRIEEAIDLIRGECESMAFVADLGRRGIVTAAEGDAWAVANNIMELIKDILKHSPRPKLELLRYVAIFKELILEQTEPEGEVVYEDKELQELRRRLKKAEENNKRLVDMIRKITSLASDVEDLISFKGGRP